MEIKSGDVWVSRFRFEPSAHVIKKTAKMVRFVEFQIGRRNLERLLSHQNFRIFFPEYAGNCKLPKKYRTP